MSHNIIPSPSKLLREKGSLEARRLRLPEDCPFSRQVMVELWTDAGGYPNGPGGSLIFRQVSGLGKEEYALTTGVENVEISFSSPNGAYYGFVTLTEMMKMGAGSVPCARIEDKPVLPLRAITDDISRGQISTLANFKSIIKRMSLFKLNMYMPYIEDVLRFQSEPEIGKYSDPVGPEEWKDIIAYAKDYFVEVRPIFNTLGHWDKMAPLQEYRDLMLPVPEGARSSGRQVLDPENPKVRPLLSRLLQEVVDVFGAGLIHAGGDEPVHLTEIHGVERSAKLYIDHYRWVHDELNKFGCTMAMYSDVFTPIWGHYAVGVEAAEKLPRDIQMVYWCYNPDHDYSAMVELMDVGFQTHISPSTQTCGRLSTETRVCYDNTEKLASTAGNRAAGIMMSNWGDAMDVPREWAWPGYATGAQFGWNIEPASYQDLMQSFHRQFYGFGEAFDFSRLAPIYHASGLFGLTRFGQTRRGLGQAFWKDARKPVDEDLKRNAPAALATVQRAHEYLATQLPRFNEENYACLDFAVKRIKHLAHKLMVLEPGPYETREQAKLTVPVILALAEDTRKLLEEARQRWFGSNRLSQWPYVEAMYLDLAESFESLARYADHCVRFGGSDKFMLAK